MSAAGYEGGAGAGGKVRKRPFRGAQSTPYDRPPTALRPAQAVEKNGWLSKLVDPASKLITYGAHKLFSSVFRKRLLPPPDPPKETKDVQPEATIVVANPGTKEPFTSGDNASKIADSNGVAELEVILKQKTFTRSEIDHLTSLLLSRTVDHSIGAERGGSEPKSSDLQAVFGSRKEKLSAPIHENGIEHVVPGAIPTPVIRSKVLEEDVASPAELAKAYMGSRSGRLSPTGVGLQNQIPREESSTPYNPPFKLRPPATSLIQKSVNDIPTSNNGFVTPRFRGRSAIYSMARTPYSRMYPTAAVKAAEAGADTHGRSSISINDSEQLNESKKQALKRRSSVLENDIGSVGPIRRIRQKPNLLHPKTLTLPASGGPRATHGSGTLLDVAELPSSSGWSSHSHSFSKSMADNNRPSTSSGYVPSQSIEMAQKIFQQLDKFTPKGKSSDLKIDIGGGTSPSKATPAVLGGLAHRSTDTVDSLKVLQSIQDNKKENGPMDSGDAHVSLPKSPKTLGEANLKNFLAFSDNLASQNGAEARVPASYSSHDTKVTAVSHSSFDLPQEKRAFQMSAHEDYLELDDDLHLNGVATTPSGEGAGSGESSKKSAVIPSSTPLKEAIAVEKPAVPELKPSDSTFGKKEPQSLADGPAITNKTIGFTFPAALPTSPSSNMATAAVTAPKSTADSDTDATQIQLNFAGPALKANSDKMSPFAFSISSVGVESAVQRDTKSELPSSADATVAKANGPAETEKSTQEFADGLKKPEDASSPVMSSAKSIFNFGSSANSAAPIGTLSSPIPTSATSSSGLFSSISSNQSAALVSLFSSQPSSGSSGLSNGFGASASTSGTVTAGMMVSTATASSVATFSASSDQMSSSATVTSVSSTPSFQFGSSVTTTSATFGTSASFSAEGSGPKSVETTSSNTTSSIFGAKSPETASGRTGISGFTASPFKTASSEAQTAASASTGSIFGFQATSAAALVSTSTQSFPSQFALSASAPAFGLSGGTNFSLGASVFGSVSSAASPSSSVSACASSSSGVSSASSSVSSASGSASSIFGSSWQPSNSTFPTSTFGTTSSPTGFSFGASANGASTDGNKSPILFGSSAASGSSSASSASFVFGSATLSSSNSSAASSSPFVFGAATSASSSSSSVSGSPFVFGSASSSAAPVFSFSSSIPTTTSSSAPSPSPSPSQTVFGNNGSTPTFASGSTPSGNNDQMSMEDSMAEDWMQGSIATPAAPMFGQSPMSAPSSGFVFGAAASASASPALAPGFMGAAAAPPSGNPFQFGSQPNQLPPQSPFQPSGSVEFQAGSAGSFSLGSGGDKANRRFVKVKPRGGRRK